MWGEILGGILGAILGIFFKRKVTGPQTAAEQKVQSYEADQKRVQAAADARDRANAGSLSGDDQSREAAARAPDPNSRD